MTKPRAGPAARRFGYLVSVLVNGAMLYGANVWPGWERVPFLTAETSRVLGFVNASIVVGIVANLVYVVVDPPRLKALGDVVTTSVGLVAMVRIWQVFPLDVASDTRGWGLVARILLGIGIVGSVIGILAAARTLTTGRGSPPEGARRRS